MNPKKSKTVRFVEKFFLLVKTSLRFWLFLLRGGLIYGLVQAGYAAFEFLSHGELQDSKIAVQLQRPRLKLAKSLGLAFADALAVILSVCLMHLPKTMYQENLILLLLIVTLAATVLLIVYTTILVFLIQLRTDSHPYFSSLNMLVTQPGSAFGIVLCLTGAAFIGYLNLVIFIALAPGLYFLMAGKILDRACASDLVQLRV